MPAAGECAWGTARPVADIRACRSRGCRALRSLVRSGLALMLHRCAPTTKGPVAGALSGAFGVEVYGFRGGDEEGRSL